MPFDVYGGGEMKEEKKRGKDQGNLEKTFDKMTLNIEQEMFALKGISGLLMGCANGHGEIPYGLDGVSILIEGIAERIQKNLEDMIELRAKNPGASPVN